jgi:uncharacterized protein
MAGLVPAIHVLLRSRPGGHLAGFWRGLPNLGYDPVARLKFDDLDETNTPVKRMRILAAALCLSLGFGVGMLPSFGIAIAEQAKPSFDCAKASLAVERVICSDANLSALDRKMARVFSERLASLTSEERKALTEDQVHWLRLRAPSCGFRDSAQIDTVRLAKAVPCLAAVYTDRIGVLKERCEIDESHTLNDMAAWDKPWSAKIPEGFKIDGGLMTFVIPWDTGIVQSLNLPTEDLPAARVAAFGLKGPYRDMALCGVVAPDGKRWLASPMRDGSLSYVLQSATRPASR